MTWTGREIRRRRDQQQLSQRQLADAVGVSPSAISRWEGSDIPQIAPEHRQRLNNTLGAPTERYEPAPEPEPFASRVSWTPAEIRRRRLALELTQARLAEMVEASKRTIIAWERGDFPPSNRYLLRLQKVLRLPSDEPDYDPGVPLREATVDDLLDRLREVGVDDDALGRILEQLQAGPLLRDASFTDTLARMVELHNTDRRGRGMPDLFRVADDTPPQDLHDHDTVESPDSSRNFVSPNSGDTPTTDK